MADAFYEDYRNALIGGGTHGQVDLDADTITVSLRDEATTVLNLTTQIDEADVTAGWVGTDQVVTSPTVGVVGVGVFDHALVTWTAVTGNVCASLDYWKDTTTPTTSPLICNIDSATGLPVTPNGGDITWDPAAGGVFQIV